MSNLGYGGFASIDEATREAPKNVGGRSKWDIIDADGKVYASGVAP